MKTLEDLLRPVSPANVLRAIALAVPSDCRKNIIIIGSLAVGYHYFGQQEDIVVRTKDADCLLSPGIAAIPAGIAIAERLMGAGWTFKRSKNHSDPGTASTPDSELPAVRLCPPGQSEWFIELLAVPEAFSDQSQRWSRLKTRNGHFGLCSFGFLSLASYRPSPTDLGVYIARPEMMALANLLEHPTIRPETMSGGFAGRADIKRSNKDLGRVLAIARLATARDEDAMLSWPGLWDEALRDRFPAEWMVLARGAGNGMRSLLASEVDLEQAWYTCVNGLLASTPPTFDAFKLVGRRVLQDAIPPLESIGRI
jgi:hypothetical protein